MKECRKKQRAKNVHYGALTDHAQEERAFTILEISFACKIGDSRLVKVRCFGPVFVLYPPVDRL
jgi:hypothetical protein